MRNPADVTLYHNFFSPFSEHLEAPILQPAFFRENELFFLAVVKSALCSCANHLEGM